MVSAALRTGHRSHVKNVFLIPLAHMHVVKKMQMLKSRMHPGCFQAIFLLENCVRNGELKVSAEFKQDTPIVITVANAVPITGAFQGH